MAKYAVLFSFMGETIRQKVCSRRDNGKFQDRQPCAACIKASQG